MTKKFDTLLERWRVNHAYIKKMEEDQRTLAEAINKEFGAEVKEKKLLASLPWQVEILGRVVLSCDIRNEEVGKFLDKLEWDDNRYGYHHALKLGDFFISLNDGTAHLSFEDVEEMVGFCQEHGIKPEVTTLNAQRSKAESEVSRLTQIMERLG